jgi:nickel-dependent lactate racemase
VNAPATLAKSLQALVGAPGSVTGKDLLVLLPDRTRAFPLREILPPFGEALLEAGASPARVTYAIASGTHVASPDDVAPLEGLLLPGSRLFTHDCDGPTALVGTTSRGTEVRVHPILLEADIVFALGAVALHYFAGFGGGGKMLFPGFGARAAIAQNHRLSLAPERGLAAGVEPGRTRDNPVALDLREAHRMLPQAYHLSVDPEDPERGPTVWHDFGEFDALCADYAERCRVGERHAADFVYARAAGPLGIDVVQAHKSLFHAALFARSGAEIILDAECPEGLGSHALARWLTRPGRERLESDARAHYDLNAQTAISLAAIAERTRVTWVSSRPLPELSPWGIRVSSDREEVLERKVGAAMAGQSIVMLHDPTERIPGDGAAA